MGRVEQALSALRAAKIQRDAAVAFADAAMDAAVTARADMYAAENAYEDASTALLKAATEPEGLAP